MRRKRDETEKKLTVKIPKSLHNALAHRLIEIGKSQQWVVLRAVKAFFLSNVRADDAAREFLFGFHLSNDPEDRVEIPMTLEQIKVLHGSIHIALKEQGVNPDDIKIQ